MQSLGLEWTYRLISEPRRLFRRYLVDDLPFALRLLVTSALARRKDQPGRGDGPGRGDSPVGDEPVSASSAAGRASW